MSTIANNGSAGAKYTAGAPLDEFTFSGWFKMSAASFSPSRAIFTLWFGSDRDSTIRVDANNGGAVYISAINYGGQYVYKGDAPGYYDVWIHYVATLDGAGNFRLAWRTAEETEYTEQFTTTTGDLTDFGLFISQWDEQISACRARSVRLYSVAHSDLDVYDDSLEVTASLGGLVVAAAEGSSADPATYASGLTSSFGTAITDADDPISGGGPTTETLEVTGESATATAGNVSLALRVLASGAAATLATGVASLVTRLTATGASASAIAGSAATRLRLSASGDSASASPGNAATRQTLVASGASATATPGAVSAVAGGSLVVDGASATVTAGSATTRLALRVTGGTAHASSGTAYAAQRVAVTGASATASAGQAQARHVSTLVVTGAALSAAAGVVARALRLRIIGAATRAVAGGVSVSGSAAPVTWETARVSAKALAWRGRYRAAELDVSGDELAVAVTAHAQRVTCRAAARKLTLELS
jgi:hypothetical protein